MLLLALALALGASGEVLFQAPSVNFTHDYGARFLVENNALCGAKSYGGALYATVGRWLAGTPASLCRVEGERLAPYPSVEMHYSPGSDPARSLVYVHGFEIDPVSGVAWLLDVGRLNIFEERPIDSLVPKLWLWDLERNASVAKYLFPESVVSSSASFLNDIVLNPSREFAYISDTLGDGAIVIVNASSAGFSSRRFTHPSMGPGGVVISNGTKYANVAPSDGIATDGVYLYYCSFSKPLLYRIPTKYLHDFSLSNAALGAHVETIAGYKGYSDGMIMDARGRLYFGRGEVNSVMQWVPSKSLGDEVAVAGPDDIAMVWPDTFGCHGNASLVFSTNNLLRFFARDLDFGETNFRIHSLSVDAPCYLEEAQEKQP